MVLGLGYVVAVMGLTLLPLHLVQMGRGSEWPPLWVLAGWLPALPLAWLAVRTPLRRGSAALRASEF
jgi:hypothetical protein